VTDELLADVCAIAAGAAAEVEPFEIEIAGILAAPPTGRRECSGRMSPTRLAGWLSFTKARRRPDGPELAPRRAGSNRTSRWRGSSTPRTQPPFATRRDNYPPGIGIQGVDRTGQPTPASSRAKGRSTRPSPTRSSTVTLEQFLDICSGVSRMKVAKRLASFQRRRYGKVKLL